MALSTVWALVNDAQFRGRVVVAIYKAAAAILNGDDPVESSRYKLAREAKDGATMLVGAFIWDVASNPSVEQKGADGQETVTDSDIEYVVSSLWDGIATLRYPPRPEPDDMNQPQQLPYVPPPSEMQP